MIRQVAIIFGISIAVNLSFGQSGSIVGAGYSLPAPLVVSPGQVITIMVSGIGQGITQRTIASELPLPTMLAGISVRWTQGSTAQNTPVPLLAVFPIPSCATSSQSPCLNLIGITLQMPYDVAVNVPGTLAPTIYSQLVATDGTVTTNQIDVFGVPNRVHVVHFGDTILPGDTRGPVVTHSDGSLVTAGNPAIAGEDLTIYVVGLGLTQPPVKAGTAAPNPAAQTLGQFVLAVDFGQNPNVLPLNTPNVPPNKTVPPQTIALAPTKLSQPLTGWLVPSLAGIYQINFRVPDPPANLPNCSPSILSNTTVSFLGSDEGANFCISIGHP